jgi:hypothetical protein
MGTRRLLEIMFHCMTEGSMVTPGFFAWKVEKT